MSPRTKHPDIAVFLGPNNIFACISRRASSGKIDWRRSFLSFAHSSIVNVSEFLRRYWDETNVLIMPIVLKSFLVPLKI